jgi:uncharacterized protein (DUF433 family)
MDYSKIITVEPGKRSGQPCIRGTRMTVQDVLEYLASGMTTEQILGDFPDVTVDDIAPAWHTRPSKIVGFLSIKLSGTFVALRMGKRSTGSVVQLLRLRKTEIASFAAASQPSFLVLS